MKRFLLTTIALVAVLVVSASAHALWVETKDVAEVGDELEVYSFFGHATSSTGIYVPMMEGTYLVIPNGEKLDLAMKTENWLPGYGWMEYSFGNAVLYWPGDYVLAADRAPGVYDPAWHGAPSDPMLSYNFAKAVIHCGEGEATHEWNVGFPLEINPDHAPYEIESGDNLTCTVTYEGEPVPAEYSASYWTWDAHSSPEVQMGSAGEDGTFTVNLNNGGLWMIAASYSIPDPGNWTATYGLGDFYDVGDVMPYNTVRYKNTLSVWVR